MQVIFENSITKKVSAFEFKTKSFETVDEFRRLFAEKKQLDPGQVQVKNFDDSRIHPSCLAENFDELVLICRPILKPVTQYYVEDCGDKVKITINSNAGNPNLTPKKNWIDTSNKPNTKADTKAP